MISRLLKSQGRGSGPDKKIKDDSAVGPDEISVGFLNLIYTTNRYPGDLILQ